ncbi:MAG: hypothetical protein HOV96_36030 [Nonomuraea sp.]|nr:hypothetical protein [Nonomuraea sp.]
MTHATPSSFPADGGGLMRRSPLPDRVLRALSPVSARYGLVLAGDHALRAHGLTGRPPGGLAFVTAGETPPPGVADGLAGVFAAEGLRASAVEVSPQLCRLVVEDATTADRCEITLTRETLREPAAACGEHGVPGLPGAAGHKVVGPADLAGLRTRDLHERGLAGDVADVAAMAEVFSFRDLERLAAAHLDGFSPRELLMRLEFVELMADESFEAHGVDEERIGEIRAFARAWAEDVKLRRADDGDADYDDPDLPEVD